MWRNTCKNIIYYNVLAHLPGLSDELDFIIGRFLLPNSYPSLWISRFYTKKLIQNCFSLSSHPEIELRDFWKYHFRILYYLVLIDNVLVASNLQDPEFSMMEFVFRQRLEGLQYWRFCLFMILFQLKTMDLEVTINM